MEKFLETFEESRDTELERVQVLEGKVEVALQQMAQNLESPGVFPRYVGFDFPSNKIKIRLQ